jgi:hypothetical protein
LLAADKEGAADRARQDIDRDGELRNPDRDRGGRPDPGRQLAHQRSDSCIKPMIVASTRKKVTIGLVKIANEISICRFIWHLHLIITGFA